jgi:hypothetical protein
VGPDERSVLTFQLVQVPPAADLGRRIAEGQVLGAEQVGVAVQAEPPQRLGRSDSGTEKTASTQPSAGAARRRRKIRASPSPRMARASADSWYPADPPFRRDCTMPRRFSREIAERVAGSSNPRSASNRIRVATESQPPSGRA